METRRNVPLWTMFEGGFRGGSWGSEPGTAETEVPCIRAADFDRVKLRVKTDSLPMRSFMVSEARAHSLRRGDLVLEKSGGGDRKPVGKVVLFDLDTQAVCSNFQARARLKARGCPAFAVYLLEALYALGRQTPYIKQTTGLQNLDSHAYLRERVVLPSYQEQEAIAEFLDAETARIDQLGVEKERFIGLLAERRAALITRVVTKGLDPAADMKDSGIEWIGEVPVGWAAGPITRHARLESGHTPSRQRPEWWVGCDVPWFTTSDIAQVRDGRKKFVHTTAECVSRLGLANSSARELPKGTVMLSRTASVGFSAIAAVPMATSQDFANWVCGPDLMPEFLLYSLRAMGGEFRRLSYGSTHKTIYMPDIRRLSIAYPPIAEQRAIADYLDRETALIDELIDATRESIALLKEYRTALISAAVTGKIDVTQCARGECQ